MSWKDDSQDFNPFSPPKFEAPQIRPTVQVEPLNEFHPFSNEPAVLQTTTAEQKKIDPNNAVQITSADLEKRQRELEIKAAELAAREEEHNRRDRALKGFSKNFPPLPSWFPMQSCFYQDIDVEIPNEYRKIVRIGFYIWLAYSVVMFLNLFGTLSYMITQNVSSSSGTLFGMSILWLLLFVPASYICWFRSLYKAFRSDSSVNFFMFFFIFFAQLIVLLIQALGINVFGSCGWIISLSELNSNKGVAIFMSIIAAAYTGIFVAGCLLFFKVHRIYRSTGASFEKAKAEFSRDLATNSTVQSAASEVGSAAFSGAINRGSKY